MRWKVQLIAETASGQRIEGEIAAIEREDLLSPGTVGLTIAEETGEVAARCDSIPRIKRGLDAGLR